MAENLVNKVAEMQQQGMSDDDITAVLAEEGANLAEISDAIEKSKIKSAVYQPDPNQSDNDQGYNQQQFQQPMQNNPQNMSGGAYPNYMQGISSETVTEIAEQIINEKMSALTKSVGTLSIFKENIEKNLGYIDERLKKVESVIEELRSAIIKKFGEYQENIEGIKNEMGMVQDSFSKVVKPWTEEVASKRQPREMPLQEVQEQENQEEEKPDDIEENLLKRLKPKRT